MVKASFGIALSSPHVHSGSAVTGQVYIDVQKTISGTHFLLYFEGKENTCVRYTRQVPSTVRGADGKTTTQYHTETHYAYGERNIVHLNLPVDELEMIRAGTVQPGRYAVPFQFPLPSFLPASMDHRASGGYCRIQYKVKAVLKGSGWFSDYKTEQSIHVTSSPYANTPTPFHGEPATAAVNLCCCFNRGYMVLGAYMSTTVLAKGQPANVHFACRNNSTVEAQQIMCELKERVHWSAYSHSDSSSRILYRTTFNPSMQGIEKKVDANQERSFDSVRNERLALIEELQVGRNAVQVVLPPTALNTYQGSIVQVSHELRIWIETKCCIDNPELRIVLASEDPAPMIQQQPQVVLTNTQPTPMLTPTAPVALPAEFTSEPIVYAEAIVVDSGLATYGGAATGGDKEEDIAVAPISMSPVVATTPPSYATLLNEMKDSVGAVDLVKKHLKEPAWQPVFAKMSPLEYGSLLSRVLSTFDEVTLAVLVAQSIQPFTCQYVAAAVKGGSDLNRCQMVEKLLEFCTDLRVNQAVIKAVLSEWEQSVTERAFEQALARA